MQYKIYNDDFDVIIDSKGCEIISVVRKQDSKQYIWNGIRMHGKDIHQFFFRL